MLTYCSTSCFNLLDGGPSHSDSDGKFSSVGGISGDKGASDSDSDGKFS